MADRGKLVPPPKRRRAACSHPKLSEIDRMLVAGEARKSGFRVTRPDRLQGPGRVLLVSVHVIARAPVEFRRLRTAPRPGRHTVRRRP
jgi:hypothetical protein